MPELPDITIYVEALQARIAGRPLVHVVIASPFLVRSVEPPVNAVVGRGVTGVSRMGKRIVLSFDGDLHLVVHLMIAGRLLWKDAVRTRASADTFARPPARIGLAAFHFSTGMLTLTEAGTKRRASLHVVAGHEQLRQHDPGGLDVGTATADEFAAALQRGNHTLKRALTNPHTFSGIGNAYSDEILHAGRLSPIKLTASLSPDETLRLFEAARGTLAKWTQVLREGIAGRFPRQGEVTAFRPDFAVHGKYGQPCPVCGVSVQRIRYAENEVNYCPTCQTGGRILADRSMSRLLKDDWPRTVEAWDDTPLAGGTA